MRCSVFDCTSDTKTTSKCQGTTFHLFPKDPNLRAIWVKALGKLKWKPRERTTICSKHFRNEDFYETKFGLRKIKSGVIPMTAKDCSKLEEPAASRDRIKLEKPAASRDRIKLEKPAASRDCSKLEEPAASRVCRICLAIDVKMYDIGDYNLDDMYEQITGIQIIGEERLPQRLCYECKARLSSAIRFKNRATRSLELLQEMLLRDDDHVITIRDVMSLNYARDSFKSPLVQKVIENSVCDIYIRDISMKDEDMEYSEGESEDEGKDLEESSEFWAKDEDSTEEIFIKEPEPSDDETDKELSGEEETDKELSGEEENDKELSGEEENDKELSGEEDGEDSSNDDDKRNRQKEYDEDIQSITEKYKKKNVKRPAGRSADLDMSLFTVTPLSYEQQIEEVRERQHSASYLEAPYKCTVCFRGCKDKNSYEAHALKHTEIFGLYECLVCKTRQKSLQALRKHLNARHTELYSCNDCTFLTKNRSAAREHQKWHAGTIYKCEHCGEEFGKRSTYLGHIRVKHVSDFVCELCGYTFVSQKGIDVHKQRKHVLDQDMPLEGPYCDVCEVKFISEDAFNRHLMLSSRHSSDDDPNRLRNCSQSMNRKSKSRIKSRIERHPIIHRHRLEAVPEPNDPISCEQCNLELPDIRAYAQHFRRDHPDKNGTKFPTKRMPCMCELCGKIFPMMALLDAHMWVHTGVKRYKCHICMKRFSQKAYLAGHLRAHSGKRPTYECPICGKHFSRDNNRKRHMFLHTGLKPFKCEVCGKRSATLGAQKIHFEHVHEKKPWPERNRIVRNRARRGKKRDISNVED